MAEAKFNKIWTFVKESNYENLGDIGTDMKCIICRNIMINAHTSSSCGCSYCLVCVQTYLNGERRFCPGSMDDCQLEPLDIATNIRPDSKVNFKISKLIVECRYSCGFRCELRNMEEHERVCVKQSANCPYVNVGCTETQLVMLQKEISSVKRDAAELRAEMANLRNENKVVSHENSSLRAEMERHRAEHLIHVAAMEQLLEELRVRVETQARDTQLMVEKCRRDEEKLVELERKAQEEELHRNIDLERDGQVNKHGQLERRVREIGTNVKMQIWRQFDWRIDGWAAKSQSAREGICMKIFSDAFYSHENGYKMCLSVCPNGDGVDKGTHLSVFFCLMKGPFDSILSWPFKHEVMLSLIDQHTGIDHISDIVRFDDIPNHVNWNRPERERNFGLGLQNLISLTALSSRNGLIQDDTILIKCVVMEANKK